jgi:L-amino acid N-acyltransferase YncA
MAIVLCYTVIQRKRKEETAMIRKATASDIDAIEAIYERIHTEQEQGRTVIGWQRGIYPTRQTAEAALQRQDLFVMTDDSGRVLGAAIFNQRQDDFYYDAPCSTPPLPKR